MSFTWKINTGICVFGIVCFSNLRAWFEVWRPNTLVSPKRKKSKAPGNGGKVRRQAPSICEQPSVSEMAAVGINKGATTTLARAKANTSISWHANVYMLNSPFSLMTNCRRFLSCSTRIGELFASKALVCAACAIVAPLKSHNNDCYATLRDC